MDGIYVDVNVPPMELTTHETTRAYVAHTIGAFRVDTITYRGGDISTRSQTCSRAGTRRSPHSPTPTGDGIFTLPELVTLTRTVPYAKFSPRADPNRRGR